jgi:hypothetical protein
MQSLEILIAAIAALNFGGCEDKLCKAELQACDAKSREVLKDLEAASKEAARLKARSGRVDELIAQVAALTIENEKLTTAARPLSPPAVSRPGKR